MDHYDLFIFRHFLRKEEIETHNFDMCGRHAQACLIVSAKSPEFPLVDKEGFGHFYCFLLFFGNHITGLCYVQFLQK